MIYRLFTGAAGCLTALPMRRPGANRDLMRAATGGLSKGGRLDHAKPQRREEFVEAIEGGAGPKRPHLRDGAGFRGNLSPFASLRLGVPNPLLAAPGQRQPDRGCARLRFTGCLQAPGVFDRDPDAVVAVSADAIARGAVLRRVHLSCGQFTGCLQASPKSPADRGRCPSLPGRST